MPQPHEAHFGYGILPQEERERLEAEQQEIAKFAKEQVKREAQAAKEAAGVSPLHHPKK